MGYTTSFSGQIDLSRELTEAEAQAIIDFSDERHGGDFGGFTTPVQGYWCNWVPTRDRLGIVWSGAEKFYNADEWMQLVIDRFIAPAGITADGVINAEGERSGNVWRLKVVDNVVTRGNGRIVFEDA